MAAISADALEMNGVRFSMMADAWSPYVGGQDNPLATDEICVAHVQQAIQKNAII
jgi:hypothetical protein